MTGRKQFEVHEISADRDICELRYTCEVAFSRVTQMNGLKDVIPFKLLSLFDDMLHWGHAMVNIGQPLQKPAKWSEHVAAWGPAKMATGKDVDEDSASAKNNEEDV